MDPYSDAPESHWDTSDFEPEKQEEEAPEQDEYFEMPDSDKGRIEDAMDSADNHYYGG